MTQNGMIKKSSHLNVLIKRELSTDKVAAGRDQPFTPLGVIYLRSNSSGV